MVATAAAGYVARTRRTGSGGPARPRLRGRRALGAARAARPPAVADPQLLRALGRARRRLGAVRGHLVGERAGPLLVAYVVTWFLLLAAPGPSWSPGAAPARARAVLGRHGAAPAYRVPGWVWVCLSLLRPLTVGCLVLGGSPPLDPTAAGVRDSAPPSPRPRIPTGSLPPPGAARCAPAALALPDRARMLRCPLRTQPLPTRLGQAGPTLGRYCKLSLPPEPVAACSPWPRSPSRCSRRASTARRPRSGRPGPLRPPPPRRRSDDARRPALSQRSPGPSCRAGRRPGLVMRWYAAWSDNQALLRSATAAAEERRHGCHAGRHRALWNLADGTMQWRTTARSTGSPRATSRPTRASWARALQAGRAALRARDERQPYPWSANVNGKTASDYVAAWKQVRGVFTKQKVTNVTWSWSP